jgi:hypothetical protein
MPYTQVQLQMLALGRCRPPYTLRIRLYVSIYVYTPIYTLYVYTAYIEIHIRFPASLFNLPCAMLFYFTSEHLLPVMHVQHATSDLKP